MLSVICFNLDQSKYLLSGNWLKEFKTLTGENAFKKPIPEGH